MRVFESRVLRNTFRPKREGGREGWKILHDADVKFSIVVLN
jgi:hypothetical protein